MLLNSELSHQVSRDILSEDTSDLLEWTQLHSRINSSVKASERVSQTTFSFIQDRYFLKSKIKSSFNFLKDSRRESVTIWRKRKL